MTEDTLKLLSTLDPAQTAAFVRGLLVICRADGIHEREVALIAALWEDLGASYSGLAELQQSEPISTEELGAILKTPEVRRGFLKAALLALFVDLEVSDKERAVIREYAAQFGMQDELANLEKEQRDAVLASLAHLLNKDGLREAEKKLKL